MYKGSELLTDNDLQCVYIYIESAQDWLEKQDWVDIYHRNTTLLYLMHIHNYRTHIYMYIVHVCTSTLIRVYFVGAEGKVDESLAMMAEVEEIKGKKKALEDEYHAAIPRHAAQQQKLRACEVCGAFLSMYDNDRRLADHFGGKLHIGFVTIRDKIKQLEVC